MNFKERMAAKQNQQKTGLSSLKSRLGTISKPSFSGGGGSIRDKFQKRSQNVLEQTYEERLERSKSFGQGKPIFNQELMAEFGITDFETSPGDRFFEIFPTSYDPQIPYHFGLPVHFGVGFNKDAFVCMLRFKHGRCYRCEKQTLMYRTLGNEGTTHTKDQCQELFPSDRECYLLWERTKELVEGESPDPVFKLWAAPKEKVHAEIQNKARNKLQRFTLDISDLSDGGDGRTVGFSISKNQKNFPVYSSFELNIRETPIPNEILEKLDRIITAANERGFRNAIEMFVNIPTYEEVKESMETEEEILSQEQQTTSKATGGFGKQNLQPSDTCDTSSQPASDEDQIAQELEIIEQEMTQISKNPLLWRKWLKDNGYEDAIGMDSVEAIPLIIDDMYEKAIAQSSGDNY